MGNPVDAVANETAGGAGDVGASGLSRRALVEGGAVSLGLVLGFVPARAAYALNAWPSLQPAPPGPGFLDVKERAFVEAAVARLIPAEGEGPGAIEAGVADFIDRQLAGTWGGGERLFLGGPFKPDAIPQLGYQLSFTPAELFRRTIAAIAAKTGDRPFAAMTAAEQDAFLSEQLEKGGLGNLDGVPAKLFFEHLLDMAVQGYFCDPIYGGNKDMVAWKAIGFPGAYDAYAETIDQHGRTFAIGPYSIADHGRIPEPDMSSMETQR